MADLRNATGETVNLIGVQGSRLVYEAVLEGGYALRSLPSLGMTVAAHCSALGKAVLAESPTALREALLGPEPYQRFTEKTITTRRDLDTELEAIRQRGYAIDEEEIETGLTCVAAAIGGTSGRPAGAMSISGLTHRMHRLDLPELGERVHTCCARIGTALQEPGS
jgi:DNA-binding IclR family transcriptional regulator